MSALLVLGVAICSLPFVAIFVLVSRADGWRVAVGVFATTAAIIAVVSIGALLIEAGLA